MGRYRALLLVCVAVLAACAQPALPPVAEPRLDDDDLAVVNVALAAALKPEEQPGWRTSGREVLIVDQTLASCGYRPVDVCLDAGRSLSLRSRVRADGPLRVPSIAIPGVRLLPHDELNDVFRHERDGGSSWTALRARHPDLAFIVLVTAPAYDGSNATVFIDSIFGGSPHFVTLVRSSNGWRVTKIDTPWQY